MLSILHSTALPDPRCPGGELRYITQHFRVLQGLRLAPLWAATLLIAIAVPLFQLSRWHAGEIFIIAVIAFAAIWLPWSHAWYRRNYGTIVTPTPQEAPLGLKIALLIYAAFFIGSALFPSLDHHRGALNLWFSLWFTLPPCFYPGPPSIFIRLRRALYTAGSVILVFIPFSILFLHPSRWFVISAVSGTLLLLSLYDHWLLHNFLHPSAPEISHD
jgi:hypothetical protein